MILAYPWPDKNLKSEWLGSKHTREKLIPKLLKRITLPIVDMEVATNALAVMSVLAKSGSDEVKETLADSGIWALMEKVLTKGPEKFGELEQIFFLRRQKNRMKEEE